MFPAKVVPLVPQKNAIQNDLQGKSKTGTGFIAGKVTLAKSASP